MRAGLHVPDNCCCIVGAENRFPLSGATPGFCCRIAGAENRFPLFGAML
jgi:hypothetical protein